MSCDQNEGVNAGLQLGKPHLLDVDAFIAAVRKSLPKRQRLSAADIQRLKQEHTDTVRPARDAATQALVLEQKLSDLVNAAYGLTPEEVKLMWDTASPACPSRRCKLSYWPYREWLVSRNAPQQGSFEPAVPVGYGVTNDGFEPICR